MTTKGFLPFILLLCSCDENIIVEEQYCSVEITEIPSLESEQEQLLYASPLSVVWDTLLRIDGTQAEIVGISRSGCSACDTCRIDNECTQCEECEPCAESCDTQCYEELRFITPLLSGDSATVRLINKYGQSDAYIVDVIQ
ncbi:MAG: hypothetical protein VX278_16045 [Myxococcota bacterium]|nr:hypothetical protein [Myxococcota bacterium]